MNTQIQDVGKDVQIFKTSINWQCYFNNETINQSSFLTRFPSEDFGLSDRVGYGMPFAGIITFISFDIQSVNTDSPGSAIYFTTNNISFEKNDFINLFYCNDNNEHKLQLIKNGKNVGLDMACIPATDLITTFTIGLNYNLL